MQDFYQLLGVSEQATPAVIKIAFEGKLKTLHKSGLPEAERMAEDRELRQAFVTLSTPSRKAWYDAKLEKERAALTATPGPWRPVAVAAVAMAAFASFAWSAVEQSRERERTRIETLRVEAGQERARAAEALQLAELKEEAQRYQAAAAERRERSVRYQMERDRAYSDVQARYNESYERREMNRQRYEAIVDVRLQQYAEDRRRWQQEADRRASQAELDRQVRWMAEREAEEARIRADKHYRAYYPSSYR